MIPDRHGGLLADTQPRHELRIHPAGDGRHDRAECTVCEWATQLVPGHTKAELQRLTDHHNGNPT